MESVQDLGYGCEKSFAAFDIYIDGRYLNCNEFHNACEKLNIPSVPVLYVGPFSKDVMLRHTDGKTVIGNGAHIREGVVIKPLIERLDHKKRRVILKSVSDSYLLRKGNTTEFS